MIKPPSQDPSKFLERFYASMDISANPDERYRALRKLIQVPNVDEPTFAELEMELLKEKGIDYL